MFASPPRNLAARQQTEHVLQAVTEQLWDCAVIALVELQDQEAMLEAWIWMKTQGHAWIPSCLSCYVSLLLAIIALHDQPSRGYQSHLS